MDGAGDVCAAWSVGVAIFGREYHGVLGRSEAAESARDLKTSTRLETRARVANGVRGESNSERCKGCASGPGSCRAKSQVELGGRSSVPSEARRAEERSNVQA